MGYYEYKFVKVREGGYTSSQSTVINKMEKTFNELGRDGWELVNFIESSAYAVFKRRESSSLDI
ncbi:TPA: DUF4177 domain-containing protein [Clostridioides difficile]